MKRCWIHIGMHKTGTTSVQYSLVKQKNLNGWDYLALNGNSNMGTSLMAMFATNPHEHYWFAKSGETAGEVAAKGEAMRAELAEMIRTTSGNNLIISGESLTLMDEEGVVRLRDFFQSLCDEVRVIGYVRTPIAYKVSFFQQQIKHMRCRFKFKPFSVGYRQKFEKFDRAFGRENVVLKKFDPASYPDGCLVRDFCTTIGLQLPEDFEVRRVNESLTQEACALLCAYHKFGPEYGWGRDMIKENNQLVLPLTRMNGMRFKLAYSLFSLNADGRSDLLWMESRLEDSLMEEFEEDGTEISSEKELLKISHESCLEFARKFQETHGYEVPAEMIPADDPVDPRKAAEFLHECRCLFRDETNREADEKRLRIAGKAEEQRLRISKKREAKKLARLQKREFKRPRFFWKSVRWAREIFSRKG